MAKIDLRPYKQQLRSEMKAWRSALTPEEKGRMDHEILNHLLAMPQFQQAQNIVTYVSKQLEIDTIRLIRLALEQQKGVAVPRCIPGTRLMDFYWITSLDQLAKGTFGVMEPLADRAQLVTGFGDSLCVVPCLTCDQQGYRLGYGSGYYDRFLANYQGVTVALCYEEILLPQLLHGKYDIPVQYIVTQAGCFPSGNFSRPERPMANVK